MEELDHRKPQDPVLLFIRADERIEMIASDQHDLEIKFVEQNNLVQKLLERMDNQVSKTGNRNTEAIGELSTRAAIIEREYGELIKQLFDKDTGLMKQIDGIRDWQANINKLAMAFIISGTAGGIILWAIKNFR